MKYLGVILDSRLTFKDRFEHTGGKATRMANLLGRIMPNLRGPIEEKRKLYANEVFFAPYCIEQFLCEMDPKCVHALSKFILAININI